MNVHYRKATPQDSDALADIHQQCFRRNWHASWFKEFLHCHHGIIALTAQSSCAGFLIWQQVPPEADIISLAVASSFRRRGIAQKLLQVMEQTTRQNAVTRLYLDVQKNNMAAVMLYQHCGFVLSGERRNYYQHQPIGHRDALCFCKHLTLSQQ